MNPPLSMSRPRRATHRSVVTLIAHCMCRYPPAFRDLSYCPVHRPTTPAQPASRADDDAGRAPVFGPLLHSPVI